MSDILSTLTESELSNQITELIRQRQEQGNATTIAIAAKKLNVKGSEIAANIPHSYKLIPSSNGDFGGQRFELKSEKDFDIESRTADAGEPIEVEQVQSMLPRKSRKSKVETEAVVKEPEYQLDEEGNQVLDEEGNPILVVAPEVEDGPTVICVICGNPVRKTSIVRRGICPLCFRQLARNVGMNATKLEALSDDEFDVILGEELSRRKNLEEYKESRKLTPDEYKERAEGLVPVKEVFAAAKEAGFGPGRVAQAMGGDRFRHEPLGGFGSIWTPFFVGARNGWYFDKAILENFAQLAKPVKEKKAKAEGGEEGAVGRKGARGAKMTPITEDGTIDGLVTEFVEPTEQIEA